VIKNNTWVHLCSVFNGSAVQLYVNGVLDSRQAIGAADTTNNTIGQMGDGTGMWLGKIDDVRVYKRALGAGEIRQLYTLGRVRI
jgi:hypothetical protein